MTLPATIMMLAFAAPTLPADVRTACDDAFAIIKQTQGIKTRRAENFRGALEKRGWIELSEFSADGHDGTSFAFRKDGVACFARGSWDGGSDDQPEIPPADPYKVTIICGKASLFARPE